MYADTNGSMMLKLDKRLLALDPHDFSVTSYHRLNTLHLDHHHSLCNCTVIVLLIQSPTRRPGLAGRLNKCLRGIPPECFIGFRALDFVACHPAGLDETCVSAQSRSSYSSTLYNSVHMIIVLSFLVIRLD